MKNNKPLITLVVIGILLVGLMFFSLLSFSGLFDKKYDREELVKEFTDHEKEFADLVAFFVANVPKNKSQKISFGLGKGNKISLYIYPTIISPGNKIIGGDDLKMDAPELDSALRLLGWTTGIVKSLRDKLDKTNCDWITTTESSSNVIVVYPNQSGWQVYSYNIFDKPIVDSLTAVYGKSIGNSEFGKRVVINSHSAL